LLLPLPPLIVPFKLMLLLVGFTTSADTALAAAGDVENVVVLLLVTLQVTPGIDCPSEEIERCCVVK